MLETRVIPCLLLRNRALVKTIGFKNAKYIGDPINTVRIYNEEEVDELIFLDIGATSARDGPQFDLVEEIASECFMPFTYGGGIRSLDQIARLLSLGVEKVAINSSAYENPGLIRQAADRYGSQSVVVSIDVRRSLFGKYEVYTQGGTRRTGVEPVQFAIEMAHSGAGELLLTSIDRDGTMRGYDIELIRRVSQAVNVPVVACGGAGAVGDLAEAVNQGGASAVAAGSMVIYQGSNRSVLINFPERRVLRAAFASI